jgi:hypothetical protein
MEILLYRPGDPPELEHDADAAMMQQLGGLFTARRGLVKALTGFGSPEQQHGCRAPGIPTQPEMGAEIRRPPLASRNDAFQSPLKAAGPVSISNPPETGMRRANAHRPA